MGRISFFGHRNLYDNESLIFDLLIKQIEPLILDGGFTEFVFGGYGEFDDLALRAVKTLKAKYPRIKTVYAQPYYKYKDKDGMERLKSLYDEVYYPELEEKPQKFAITYRNREMIDNSDFCVFYVKRDHGGAFDALKYAKRKNKELLNIAERL